MLFWVDQRKSGTVASDDTTVQLWDLADRTRPLPLGPPLEGHKKAVNSVAIGPTNIMATGSDDQTVRLWNLAQLDGLPIAPT